MVEYKNPNDMKLTIKNYKRIVGEWPNIVIKDATEEHEYYHFYCHYPGSSLDYRVTLSRYEMNTLPGIFAYPFVSPNGEKTRGVSADWFGDMVNAISAIKAEFDNVWEQYNP